MGNTRSFADAIEWHLDALIKAKKIDFQGGHSPLLVTSPGSDAPLPVLEHIVKQTFDIN